ncbi:hypothetical protein A3H03_03110 [Candidatus Kuenenbacteria bacterium RIFCSPLOWO2_12_FULL_42_13]|uniref:Uncharacterized protein n=4 Tax=Candidatus Kueneniibacteriota TaxID=1752740 RepID=A0A0G0YXG6_9BACT|nr:MAG: hypothetical protein UV02_C0029G0002 [Candidatus Kuenenbacteria bacterium GW2011_GWA2_42_15]OGG91355.1 MAG: hypothetical protein A3H55_03780 [Candidatus Kuenenbacteria bacterium RIFCSPLOWO2_02_FULL_42_16]OGG92314.1 MAG: hypothetical protein A3H03_03110 [Candidatus Kuenenbacteria bacterium RIFCSPLOWO2_12_FULL_42_13]OGG95676.1 MAG: hypothetical protein A2V95_01275 [Candidatus Kuenenbacteria bacterium RBG_16_41_7]
MFAILKKIINDLFYISLLIWLIYFMLELLKEGLISNYFDLNLLLIFAVILGVVNIQVNYKKYDDRG